MYIRRDDESRRIGRTTDRGERRAFRILTQCQNAGASATTGM
jgi:hypothetical protein